MRETKLGGMQPLPPRTAILLIMAAPVDFVTNHRMAKGGQVDTDLVGTSGIDADVKQRVTLKTFYYPVAGPGKLTTRPQLPLEALGLAGQWRLDHRFRLFRYSIHQRLIVLVDLSI